jgi:endonuclease-3
MVLRTPEELEEIKKRFLNKYKGSKTELVYNNDYELLVDIILSAQCTDKRVNMITPALFKKYPTIKDLANANLDDVKELIKSCSFFNNKAKNIVEMAKKVVNEYQGKIPRDHKDLIKLPGVGNKTANVFLIELHNENRMAVDTHVFRVVFGLLILKPYLKPLLAPSQA